MKIIHEKVKGLLQYFIKRFYFILVLFLAVNLLSFNQLPGNPRVLVFSKTSYEFHSSTPVGIAAITELGEKNGFDVDTTTNTTWFNKKQLQKYAAIIFFNTADSSDELLNSKEKIAFENYIKAGGGYVGIHAAADAGNKWRWYRRLVGASLTDYAEDIQLATLNVINISHAATVNLPTRWPRTDEWYNFQNIDPTLKVLVTIDETSYEGGTNGAFHPVIWYHEYNGGRAFYTALGHTEESYSESEFLNHLLGGIRYAMGGKK